MSLCNFSSSLRAGPSVRDVCGTQIPRFAFEKFPGAKAELTTQMKSVGEAMAIGRTFQESFQKVQPCTHACGMSLCRQGAILTSVAQKMRMHKLQSHLLRCFCIPEIMPS